MHRNWNLTSDNYRTQVSLATILCVIKVTFSCIDFDDKILILSVFKHSSRIVSHFVVFSKKIIYVCVCV